MFSFNIRKEFNSLSIQVTAADNIPCESPVIICYTEEGDLSKHEVLRRFNENLNKINYDWIRPLKNLTNEWIIDLKQMKHTFEVLKNTSYLKAKITIEPEYFQSSGFEISTNLKTVNSSSIKFSIYPNEINSSNTTYDVSIENDLIDPMMSFRKDFPNPQKCCFLMMKFEDSNEQTKIVKFLKSEFTKKGLSLIRVDDKAYSDDLFVNIKTHMHGCSFGLALFERINTAYFNPNVSLEIGYMMALKKPILFLKDKNLDSLHSDLVGKLYSPFDVQNYKKTIPAILEKWLKEKDII